ncbi:MAG: phenylalanine--tRNA ligase subunit alpha, partial [Terriglobia bacterium]
AHHTLEELAVRDTAALQALFQKITNRFVEEAHNLVRSGPANAAELEGLRIRWLGRKQGIIRGITDNWLRTAPPDLKPNVGAQLNKLRNLAEAYIEVELPKSTGLKEVVSTSSVPVEAQQGVRASATIPIESGLDITLPGRRRAVGVAHPLRRAIQEITEIFLSLGYSVEEGPDIESTYYNFEALNIPEDHPARDDQDTFYIDPQTVLRTHTSPVQIRTMEKMQPPVRIIVPGRAFRHDAPDATHSPFFHQVEGLAVDTNITFCDLKGTLDHWMKAFFGPQVRTRFRPSFFPFTEPSAEVDISCLFCGGESGCRICKHSGWIELGGCGMVDPAVYSFVHYDASRYSGFAFGMGIERLAMLKYGVQDIQLFYQSDLRFLHQFR